MRFLRNVFAYYRAHGRHDLPWRATRDPYKILVSEVMLQQTQAARVIPKYKEFLKVFPDIRILARSPLSSVLTAWSGLGYNRRAKYLHDAAKIVVKKYRGRIPHDAATLITLPGVGEYTASAIRAFAFNQPDVLIETNIRTVFFHLGVRTRRKIKDEELRPLVEDALRRSRMSPREFYSALMDYGAYLKASGVRLNARSRHYTKQSRFQGSLREVRGAILKTLTARMSTDATRKRYKNTFEKALVSLVREGLVERRGSMVHLAR
ncbi:MAG TPA: A/G-specific adenine glycosylase [Candidatus Paceibacterota bacterium]